MYQYSIEQWIYSLKSHFSLSLLHFVLWFKDFVQCSIAFALVMRSNFYHSLLIYLKIGYLYNEPSYY